MTYIELFLAGQKRYSCERLAAILTTEQCKQNRTREAVTTKGINSVMQCKGCPGLDLSQPVTAIATGGVEMSKSVAVIKTCLKCGQEKKHHGRGLCSKCYMDMDRATLKEKFPPIGRPATYGSSKPIAKTAAPELPVVELKTVDLDSAEAISIVDRIEAVAPGFELVTAGYIEKNMPKGNPLLTSSGPQIVLDLRGKETLYAWIIEREVTPAHILELLDVARVNGLKVAA